MAIVFSSTGLATVCTKFKQEGWWNHFLRQQREETTKTTLLTLPYVYSLHIKAESVAKNLATAFPWWEDIKAPVNKAKEIET